MTCDATVLRLLRLGDGHVLPSEVARGAELTPSEVARCMAGLREAGFEVEHHPSLGYKLLASPDRLIADDLWARLAGSAQAKPLASFLREIIVLRETVSTNDVAAQLGRDGAAGAVAVFAERQTGGRGRLGRRWESAAGQGVWCSLLLRPRLPLGEWPRCTTWGALAAARAIEKIAGCALRLKWPNDLELAGRKVAGLLAEVAHDFRGAAFLVLGLGINVNHAPEAFPPGLAGRATSLRQHTGALQDRAALAAALLRELASTEQALEQDFAGLVAEASRRSTLLGQQIEVRIGETVLRGIAERLDEDGHLVLRTAVGEMRTLSAGEATLAL